MVCDSLCTIFYENLQLWKVHITYEWIISQPLNFDTIFRCHFSHHSLGNIIEIRKESHRRRHESYIIFNVVQRAHAFKMQIFASFSVAAQRNKGGKKYGQTYFIRCNVTWIGGIQWWCRSRPKTRRENNNNKLGSFQWKYIMTTSSRNWSYIRVFPTNAMALAAYATSCSLANPTKR